MAFQRRLDRRADGLDPRRVLEQRRGHVFPVGGAVEEVYRLFGAGKAVLCAQRGGIVVILFHVAAKEVARQEGLAVIHRPAVDQVGLRGRKGEAHGHIVHRLDGDGLAIHGPAAGQLFGDLGVGEHVVIPEHHVPRGKGRTVRPFVPAAQREGQLRIVVVPGPGFRHVGHDRLEIVRIPHKIDMPHRQEIGCARFGAARGPGQHAAILTDGRVGGHDKRLFGQAFGQRRQVRVPGDARIEIGDLRVLGKIKRAIARSLKFRQFELLRIGRRKALHVGNCRFGTGRGGERPGQRQGGCAS